MNQSAISDKNGNKQNDVQSQVSSHNSLLDILKQDSVLFLTIRNNQ